MTSLDLVDFASLKSEETPDEPFAHYAEAASATEGYVTGTPVIALCEKVFVPSRNPERLKVCPICKEIMDLVFLSGE